MPFQLLIVFGSFIEALNVRWQWKEKLREDIQKKRPQADTGYFFMEEGGGRVKFKHVFAFACNWCHHIYLFD